MNRNIVYFTQRVLSAATNAAVYVIADMISQEARKKSMSQNRKPLQSPNKPNKNRKLSYAEYANNTSYQTNRTEHKPAGNRTHHRSMNEQVKDRRKKGMN